MQNYILFEVGLKQSYSKTIDNSEVNGYYLGVKSCPNSKVKDLDQWRRLFINLKSKTKKIYGSTDNENDFANNMAWAYECLLEILSGENENFPIEHDIKTLLEQRSNEICSYVIRVVEMKQKTYINSKRNPNYIVHQKGGKWLSWVINRNDYAGNLGKSIDAIQIKGKTYRVYDNKKGKWLPWVSSENDFAGNIGNSIGAIQIK